MKKILIFVPLLEFIQILINFIMRHEHGSWISTPKKFKWQGPNADFSPEDNDLPWSLEPDHKITVEDIKYLMSSYYQGTKFNPYGKNGDLSEKGKYRSIGINRTSF